MKRFILGIMLIWFLSASSASAQFNWFQPQKEVKHAIQVHVSHVRHHRHRVHPTISGEHGWSRGDKPHAWCGWYMRQRHGGGPELNLAANWASRGVSTGPGVGVIVVWPHHVGEITGYDSKRHEWIVLSGNSGPNRTVTEHPRSLGGAIAFRSL